MYIVAIIFTFSGTILALSFANPSNFDLEFVNQLYIHTSVYFSVCTLLTLQYGDIVPATSVSQVYWI